MRERSRTIIENLDGHFGTVRSRDDATTRSRGRGCQRDETHRGRHLRREIDSTARARGEGIALSERDLTLDRKAVRRPIDGRGKRSVSRDATVFVRVCARSVDANAGGRCTSGHRSMRRSRCVRPRVGKCASCGGKLALQKFIERKRPLRPRSTTCTVRGLLYTVDCTRRARATRTRTVPEPEISWKLHVQYTYT